MDQLTHTVRRSNWINIIRQCQDRPTGTTDNESAIQESISKLIRDKTVLIIAHRMRTVDGVDRIVVLKGGTVAEQGTPKQLKAQNGIYRHMVDLQLASEQWKYC